MNLTTMEFDVFLDEQLNQLVTTQEVRVRLSLDICKDRFRHYRLKSMSSPSRYKFLEKLTFKLIHTVNQCAEVECLEHRQFTTTKGDSAGKGELFPENCLTGARYTFDRCRLYTVK